jgi:hypothetical protein
MKKFMRSVVFSAMVVMAPIVMVTPALAGYMVDGVINDSEGYTGYDIVFDKEGGGTTGGTLYLGQENGFLYGALVLPKDFVDNSYGANAVDWPGGNKKKDKGGHPLEKLEKSDAAEITVKGDDGSLTFEMDYGSGEPYGKNSEVNLDFGKIAGDGNEYSTSLAHNFEETEVNGVSGFFDYTSGDPSSPETEYKSWSDDDKKAGVKYSEPGDDAYDVTNPTYKNWVFDVIYEFQVKGFTFFGENTGVSVGEVHASPSKFGKNKIFGPTTTTFKPPPPNPPGAAVPEPATILLLGGGLAAFAGRQWRNRRKSNNRA